MLHNLLNLLYHKYHHLNFNKKMDILANIIKSCSFYILNYRISGSHITTFSFPPKLDSLASISPKVRET